MTAVRRALLLSTADRYFTLATNFVVAAAVSRILTPSEIGVSVVGMAILGIALSVREFASANFLIQRDVLTGEDIRASFSVMTAVTAMIVAVLLAATPTLSHVYGQEELAPYFHVICISLFIDLISIQVVTLLQRDIEYGRIATIHITGAMVGAIVTVVLALSGFSYMSFAWAWLATSVVAGLVSIAMRPQWRIFRPSLSNWHGMIRFGGYNGGTALLYKFYETLPYMLFGWVLSPHAAAVFSRSVMICQLPQSLLLGGAMAVVLPAFSNEAREGRSLRRPYLHSLEIVTAVYWPALLVISVLAGAVVHIVLGSQWQDAVDLVRIMAIAHLFSFSFRINYPVMVAIGAIRDSFLRALMSFPVSALVLMGAIVLGGLEAAAWSMLVAMPFQAVVAMSFLQRRLSISCKDLARTLWRSGVTTLLAAAGPLCLVLASGDGWHTSAAQTVAACVLAGAGWLVGLLATRHPLIEEIGHVMSSLRPNRAGPSRMAPILED
jgi:O-antigen/teichoic acid export membrane protein